MKKLRLLFIMFLVLTLALYTKVEAATKEVELGQEKYEVKNGKEYTSRKEIEYIKILSDRSGTSRISLEFDLSLIKDYDSTNGIVEYNNLKKWLNNLEDVYDLFCELNLKPNKDEIVIDYTGIREQIQGAYVNGDSNRIVVNKQYNINSIKILDRDYNNGLINLDGTVIHEMGHVFTKIENGPSFTNEPWTYGNEYINQAMVQYVLDKIILSKDNIVTTINPYDYVILASKNVKTYTNLNGEQKEVVHSYKDGYDKLLNKYNVYYPSDASYTKLIYNISAILDAIGLDSVKNVFNYYGNNDLSYYTWASKYDKFILFMNIVKQNTTNEIWNSVQSNYNEAYDKFVINISTGNIGMKVIKGKEFLPVYNVSYNSSNHKDNYQIKFLSKNSNVVQVQENGKLYAKNLGYATIEICVGNQSETIDIEVVDGTPISSMKINTNSYTFTDIDEIYTPSVDITPSNATNTKLKWLSSDKSIATVNIISGKITPVGNGKCKINVYATDGSGLVAQLDVKVDIKAKSVALDKTSLKIASKNSTNKLVATVTPSQASQKVAWSSSNGKIATVDSKGRVKAVSNGKCKIIATTTDGTNRTASCDVTVDVKFVTGISFDFNSYTITNVNQTPVFRPNITPSDAEDKNVRWSSSNTKVATVSSSGVIKAAGNGTCKITATTTDGTNLSASFNITVNIKATKITLDKTKIELTTGKETEKITPSIEPSIANKNVKYTSSDESVATVSSDGVVTAVGSGTCKITAAPTDGSKVTASCDVTVDIKTTEMKLDKTNYTFNKAETIKINPVITPSKASKKLTWTSSNTKVAIVSSDGKVTPVGKGTCKIIATTTDGTNIKGSCNIIVDIKPMVVGLDKTSYTFNDNQTMKLNATILPSQASDTKLNWTSDNESIATVDGNGVVTPVKNGTCNITATTADGTNIKGNCNITVDFKVKSISFSTTSYTITSVNQTPSFRAIISPSNAANKSIKWTSSDENVAKVSTNGVIKPVKSGTCKIIATTTDGTNLSASIDITVDIKATKITLDKTNINLTNEKYSDKITAKIEPSEASDKVKYTSSNEKVAKVKEDGTVIAVGKGNCIITATTTDGTNLSAKCNVTSEVEYQKGDVNKDGRVDVADVIYAMNKLSKGTLTDEEKIIGNVNDDSIFDVADVIKIMRYLSGKISSL